MDLTQDTDFALCGNIQDAPLLLSAEQLARLLGVSIRTLWRLRAAGKLPAPVRLGGSVRWRPSDIESWVAAGCPQLRVDAVRK